MLKFYVNFNQSLIDSMSEDRKGELNDACKDWKFHDIHKESCFDDIQTTNIGKPYKRGPALVKANSTELKINASESKLDHKIVNKNEESFIEFLDKNNNVGDESEEEVDKYFKEAFSYVFCKTFTKNLIKKLIDLFVAGMKICILAIGLIIAKIVAWVHPLPDYEVEIYEKKETMSIIVLKTRNAIFFSLRNEISN